MQAWPRMSSSIQLKFKQIISLDSNQSNKEKCWIVTLRNPIIFEIDEYGQKEVQYSFKLKIRIKFRHKLRTKEHWFYHNDVVVDVNEELCTYYTDSMQYISYLVWKFENKTLEFFCCLIIIKVIGIVCV